MVVSTLLKPNSPLGYAEETRVLHHLAIERVISAMRADVSYPFTLDDFAQIARYSPFHFARLFRQVMGSTPGEFLAALRFDRAKHLILETDASITDICFDVGFSSLGTFSARFKHLVGLSPVELRTMPELLAKRLENLANVEPQFIDRDGLTLVGVARSAAPRKGHLFIGLFPVAIPQGAPISGTLLDGPGSFTLHKVPYGTYRLMAAMFPISDNPLDHLLPGDALQVAIDPDPVIVEPGVEPRRLSVTCVRASPPIPQF